MSLFAFVALFGWIPFVIVLFALVPARTAAMIAVIGGWLLLPPARIAISGLPDFSKITAAVLGMAMGTLLFAPDRLLAFRPRWFDLPMLLFCCCGIFSSLENGLGLYDGLAEALAQSLIWGLPYLFGRLYFSDLEGLRAFAVAMVIGGLGYTLPCLWEARMSPQLMRNIYGIANWEGGMRFGGYRPYVFFATGLELGLWMAVAWLTAWWLWHCGIIKQIGRVSFGPVLFPLLTITTILCRSTGAFALLVLGVMTLWLSTRLRTRLLLAGLLLIGPLYVAVRVPNLWSGQQAVNLVSALAGDDRAESLAYRFQCEDLLIGRAVEQPIFGWGGWDRNLVYFNADQPWRKPVPTDGLWIITLGTKGYVGLVLLYLALILPAALFVRRFPARLWGHPQLASGLLAAVLASLYVVDCLVNGFPNMIYLTLAGGLAGTESRQLLAIVAKRRQELVRAAGRGVPSITASSAIPTRAGLPDGRVRLVDRYRDLGRGFKQEDRRSDAESAWRRALDLASNLLEAKPDSLFLRLLWCDCANDLAWLQANDAELTHGDFGHTLAMARRLVQDFPDINGYWNTLGVAYYRAGDYTAAIAALDRATALSGGTAFDDVFLAMAHARLGNLGAARRELDRAIERAERDFPGHRELAGFCEEARFIIAEAAGAPTAVS